MAENPASFKKSQMTSLDFLYNMIRQQKYTSAAAAKKAAAALRAQLHQELENKKLCAYQPHECNQLTLEGYSYCLRHIMEDKSAPFKQCNYVYNNNGKRCHLPAPKGDKKEHVYCSEHAFKSHLTRVRAAARHQPANSMESMLDSLSHHVAKTGTKSLATTDDFDDEKTEQGESLKVTKSLDPFNDVNASVVNASRSRILDYGSESESDVEPAAFTNVWHDAQADSSEDESIDSEQEDVLKHAGIYTAEEVTLVTRDKLIRLQSLYIEQFKHLQHILKEKRRKYLQGLKREKESLSSIHDQVKDTPKEKRLYNKLKVLNHYHKKHGIDAIMNKKFTELRSKLSDNGAAVKPQKFDKCIYMEGGVKCGERSLPVTKYCRKHILHNQAQVLFKRCTRVHANIECQEPVLAIFGEPVCKYHMDYPPIRNYGETRTFDESDLEDSSDIQDHMASSSCESKAPATVTSAQFMNFSNQFPSASTSTDLVDQSAEHLQDVFTIEHAEELLAQTPEEYMDDVDVDVTNEIDITSVEENVNFVFSGHEESNSSINTPQIKMETETEVEMAEVENETVDTETSVVDPDDDMAGIMLEMQKDPKLQDEPVNST